MPALGMEHCIPFPLLQASSAVYHNTGWLYGISRQSELESEPSQFKGKVHKLITKKDTQQVPNTAL